MNKSSIREALAVQRSNRGKKYFSIGPLKDVNKIESFHKHLTFYGEPMKGRRHKVDDLNEDALDKLENIFTENRFPNVQTVKVKQTFSQAAVVAISKSCPNITSLEFEMEGGLDLTFSFDSFMAVLSNCKNLQKLTIEREVIVPDSAPLDMVRRNCQNLIILNIYCSYFPRQLAKYLFCHTQKLRFICSKEFLYVRSSVTLAELAPQFENIYFHEGEYVHRPILKIQK